MERVEYPLLTKEALRAWTRPPLWNKFRDNNFPYTFPQDQNIKLQGSAEINIDLIAAFGLAAVLQQLKDGKMTRREFLRLSGVLGIGTLLLASGCGGLDDTKNEAATSSETILNWETQPTMLKHVEPKPDQLQIRLGETEYKWPNSPRWFPDGRTSWIRDKNGKLIVFGSAGPTSVRFEGSDWNNLGKAVEVLQPDRIFNEYGHNGYRGLHTVIPLPDGTLLGVTHKENWPGGDGVWFPFTAEIEVTQSRDNGLTWSKPQTVLRSHNIQEGANEAQGVGQPGCIVAGKADQKYLYTYFTDWFENDDICLARVPLEHAMDATKWKKWDGKNFNEPGLGGHAEPVVSPNDVYTALPQITWNEKGGEFWMLNEQNTGIILRRSKDGVNWSDPQVIAEVPSPLTSRRTEQDWYSYPTLIQPDSRDQFTLQPELPTYLLVSRGVYNISAHRAVMIPVEIG